MDRVMRDLREMMRDLWWAPLFWPLWIFCDSAHWVYGWHWSGRVVLFAAATPLVMGLTFAMVPVQAVMFAGILTAAVVTLPVAAARALYARKGSAQP